MDTYVAIYIVAVFMDFTVIHPCLIMLNFQFKLSDIEEVSLLTKKGYLTIALSYSKDARVLLRRHEGIRDWFNLIKVKTKTNLDRDVSQMFLIQSCSKPIVNKIT